MTTKVKEQLLAIISKHLDNVSDFASSTQININLDCGMVTLEDFSACKDSLNIDLGVINY